MGGDHGPSVTLPACQAFLDSHPHAQLVLVGLPEVVAGFSHPRARHVAASEVVTMDDPLETALRLLEERRVEVLPMIHARYALQDGVRAFAHAAARNVLVVDDNDRHLDILSTILTSVGHDVETCGSGAEALRRLDMRHYDVVVLDLVMPEVSGLVVAEQMRNCMLNRHTPVIICTANISLARRQLAEVPGIASIIGKPIDTANLILAVAKAPIRERANDRRSDQIRL